MTSLKLALFLMLATSLQAQAFEIHAHRGGAGRDLHESSLKAFHRSIEQGANVLEFDVQMTADEQFVISHDSTFNLSYCACSSPTVPRNFSYAFRQMQLKDILTFIYNDDRTTAFPELESMIEALPTSTTLSIELKMPKNSGSQEMRKTARNFLQILRKKNLFSRVVIQSFDREVLEAISTETQANKETPRLSYLYMGDAIFNVPLLSKIPANRTAQWETVFEFALKIKAEMISPRIHLVKNREAFADLMKMRELRAPKMKIIPWTVNTPADVQLSQTAGCDGVITDNVRMALEVIRSSN